jgi:hypothetical protein
LELFEVAGNYLILLGGHSALSRPQEILPAELGYVKHDPEGSNRARRKYRIYFEASILEDEE